MAEEVKEEDRKPYLLFAEILEYPTSSFYECFDECICFLLGRDCEAADLLRESELLLARMSLTQMQETYTRTFDLQPACYPYVGYHLFGEDHRRLLFMSGLKRHYLSHSFSVGQELPDHLPIILRFLAQPPQDKEKDELVHECLILALEKMLVGGVREGGNPYGAVLKALLLMLRREKAERFAQSA